MYAKYIILSYSNFKKQYVCKTDTTNLLQFSLFQEDHSKNGFVQSIFLCILILVLCITKKGKESKNSNELRKKNILKLTILTKYLSCLQHKW